MIGDMPEKRFEVIDKKITVKNDGRNQLRGLYQMNGEKQVILKIV